MRDPILTTLTEVTEMLPPERREEVLDFAQFILSKCETSQGDGSSSPDGLADEQREAIRGIAGRSLGPGFNGREHDAILYGGKQ